LGRLCHAKKLMHEIDLLKGAFQIFGWKERTRFTRKRILLLLSDDCGSMKSRNQCQIHERFGGDSQLSFWMSRWCSSTIKRLERVSWCLGVSNDFSPKSSASRFILVGFHFQSYSFILRVSETSRSFYGHSYTKITVVD
jgi:hypothetical protein